ncbi:hypothetical protein [Xanthobacter autotrophicus]|uniref:oxidoreductase n=1 Tax=Xanthobacter autotrophicus TaxID=280 RepID=UPI0024A78256|nr:hypothetical protein [Xanthobacter autotrophicus]MDI4658005.1 hypothetical protein [Xanthobacter autotrophicus]
MNILSDRLTFFVGVNTGFVTGGLPDERYIEFYRARSSARLSCAIVGNVVVPGGHGSNDYSTVIDGNPIWGKVAAAIRMKGSLPGIQLATTWPGYIGSRKFLSSHPHEIIDQARLLVQSLCEADVERIIDAFTAGAALAVEHGFGHVQVHAAHGYLPSLLMDDRISLQAKQARHGFRAFAEWLRSREIQSSIRFSLKTGDNTFDASGSELFQDTVIARPFDFIDLSSGFYNIDKRLIYL